MDGLTIGTLDLAKLFGVTRETIGTWKKERGLASSFISRGTWDLKKAVQWWAENVFFPKDSKSIASARERWELARAEKLELQIEKFKNQHYEKVLVDTALEEIIQVTKRAFQLIPDHASAAMVGHGPEGQREILQGLVDEVLIGLSERATIGEIQKRITVDIPA